jgi:hypothetical protein
MAVAATLTAAPAITTPSASLAGASMRFRSLPRQPAYKAVLRPIDSDAEAILNAESAALAVYLTTGSQG